MKNVCALFLLIFIVFTGLAEAKDPDLSYWMKDISESALSSEPGNIDESPQIVVFGSTVHVLWTARKADWTAYELYYRRSVDGGVTWEAKQLLLEDTQPLTDYTARKMAVDGTTVHIFTPHRALV
jgi:hypothetical protein